MTGNDCPPAVSIGLLKKLPVPFLSLAQTKINTECMSAAGSKPISALTQASPGPCLALHTPTSMLRHAAGRGGMSSVRLATSFGTPYGDLSGREHPARDLNASLHHPPSLGEERESCCRRSPVLLPRRDRLQRTAAERREKWWQEKTMASGTHPWGTGSHPLPTGPCQTQRSPPGSAGMQGGEEGREE